jgi:Na+-transporting methylmalonyl-CoA/oxaloacetate decarboxylase gamma subunit
MTSALPGAPLLVAGQSNPTPPPAPASGQEFGSASTLGFVVLVLFFIAVAFLARSMAKHLKRVQKPFEDAERAANEAASTDEAEPTPDPESAPSPESDHKADA